MKYEKYNAKGNIVFVYILDDLKYKEETVDDIIEEACRDYPIAGSREFVRNKVIEDYSKSIYDLIDGRDFLEQVDSECIMDYDGTLYDVFVDGYISNLGLCHKGL